MNSPPPSPPSSSSLFRSRLHEQYVLKQDTDLVLYLSSQHLRMGGLYWGITTLDLLGYDHTLKDQIMWGGGQNDRCGSTEAGRISKAPVCSIAGSPVSTGPATSAGSPVSTCSADITATTTESATPCIIAATSAGIYVSTGHATSAGSSVSTVSATSAGIPVSTVSATSAGSSVSTCSVDITATESSASSQAGLHVVCRGRDEVINWIGACQNEDGGFGPSLHHDSHLASTHCGMSHVQQQHTQIISLAPVVRITVLRVNSYTHNMSTACATAHVCAHNNSWVCAVCSSSAQPVRSFTQHQHACRCNIHTVSTR
eukprot:GHVS01009008.1.p1 GENE.GHVS01009008.1~~GHVS01009008.1.p1  ORF type:complete len:314 (+),score=58.50 GHVS01009008.1:2-943(+)